MILAYQIDDHESFSIVTVPKRIRPALPVPSHSVGANRYPVIPIAPDRLSEYEAYDIPNWDGYNAEPILSDTVRAARGFNRLLPREVPEPDIAPGGDATIGFEWYSATERRWVVVDVGPGDLVKARVDESGRIERFAPTTVATGARALIGQLFRDF